MQCDLARLCLPEVQYGIVSPYSALNTAVEGAGGRLNLLVLCLSAWPAYCEVSTEPRVHTNRRGHTQQGCRFLFSRQ